MVREESSRQIDAAYEVDLAPRRSPTDDRPVPTALRFEVNHITDWQIFIGLGLGTEFAALVILLIIFKRLGWA